MGRTFVSIERKWVDEVSGSYGAHRTRPDGLPTWYMCRLNYVILDGSSRVNTQTLILKGQRQNWALKINEGPTVV
jgi:hypothetical protein